MLLEVARPVRRGPTRATASTKLKRSLEMAEFYAEPREPGGTGGPAGSRANPGDEANERSKRWAREDLDKTTTEDDE